MVPPCVGIYKIDNVIIIIKDSSCYKLAEIETIKPILELDQISDFSKFSYILNLALMVRLKLEF